MLVAQALVALALVGGGVLIGMAVFDDPSPRVARSTVNRLKRSESEGQRLRGQAVTAEAQAKTARRRARAAARTTRRLRADLRGTRQALRKARP
jgi:hypothetical protein